MQLDQVANTTAYQTLENEYIALNGKLRMATQIGVVNLIPFINRNVVRRAIGTLFERKIVERRVRRPFVVLAPVKKVRIREKQSISVFLPRGDGIRFSGIDA